MANELELWHTEIPKPEIPSEWDFHAADTKFDKHIRNWRRLSGDVISTLWIFYNKLKVQGRRSDLSANADKLTTWLGWLEAKGIGSDTPIRHFKALGWLPSDSLEWYQSSQSILLSGTKKLRI